MNHTIFYHIKIVLSEEWMILKNCEYKYILINYKVGNTYNYMNQECIAKVNMAIIIDGVVHVSSLPIVHYRYSGWLKTPPTGSWRQCFWDSASSDDSRGSTWWGRGTRKSCERHLASRWWWCTPLEAHLAPGCNRDRVGRLKTSNPANVRCIRFISTYLCKYL